MALSKWRPSQRICKVLFGAADQCGYPGCSEPVLKFASGALIVNAEIAHVRGRRPGSARHDPSFPEDQVDREENLLLLCTTHHRQVDHDPANAHLVFSVDMLLGWKRQQIAASRRRELSLAQVRAIIGALTEVNASVELVRITNIRDQAVMTPLDIELSWPASSGAQIDHLLGVRITNSGYVPFDVAEVGVHLRMKAETVEDNAVYFPPMTRYPFRLQRDNRLLHQQNGCWVMDPGTVFAGAMGLFYQTGILPAAIRGFARLGGDERIESEWISIRHLPGWKEDMTEEDLTTMRAEGMELRRRGAAGDLPLPASLDADALDD